MPSRKLSQFKFLFQAETVQSELRAYQIESQIVKKSREYSVHVVGGAGEGFHLEVDAKDYERALNILDLFLKTNTDIEVCSFGDRNYFKRTIFFSFASLLLIPIVGNIVALLNLIELMKVRPSKLKLGLAILSLSLSSLLVLGAIGYAGFQYYLNLESTDTKAMNTADLEDLANDKLLEICAATSETELPGQSAPASGNEPYNGVWKFQGFECRGGESKLQDKANQEIKQGAYASIKRISGKRALSKVVHWSSKEDYCTACYIESYRHEKGLQYERRFLALKTRRFGNRACDQYEPRDTNFYYSDFELVGDKLEIRDQESGSDCTAGVFVKTFEKIK